MSNFIYHYVFTTYKRKSILTDPEIVQFLYATFSNIAAQKGFSIITCKILEDHVHCLIGFDLRHRHDYVIRMIKGISSREFFKAYTTNRLIFRKLWGRGYYGEKIDKNKLTAVINYINSQVDESGYDKRYNINIK